MPCRNISKLVIYVISIVSSVIANTNQMEMIIWLLLEGLLSKKWKDYYFVLFNDSTLQWFEKQSDRKPEGSIVIRNVAQNLCVGPYTRCLLNRPSFPRPTDEANIIALPRSTPGHHGQEIVWILCNDVTHLKWAMLWGRKLPWLNRTSLHI